MPKTGPVGTRMTPFSHFSDEVLQLLPDPPPAQLYGGTR